MRNTLLTVAQAADLIAGGAVVIVAGPEELLAALPTGNWIGGTTAYLMSEAGGRVTTDCVFCSVIDVPAACRIVTLAPDDLARLTDGRYENGFTYLLLPAFSQAHQRYALEGPGLHHLYDQPVMGWIAGVHLSELGQRTPKVFDGRTGTAHEDAGVALYVDLGPDLVPDLDIINLFRPGRGPTVTFYRTGFAASACHIDGQAANLAAYMTQHGVDTRLPLVADYAGAMVNVSIRGVDPDRGEVQFYAPVVAGEIYRFAQSVDDYAGAFRRDAEDVVWAGQALSCNCILNYLYAELEGKTAGGYVGPITFGEIAYILLNQTLVVLRCEAAAVVDRRGALLADA